MFQKAFIVGLIAVSPLVAVAADRPADQVQYRTVTAQGFQGQPVTIRIPASEQAPYALTGRETQKTVRWVTLPAGQGGPVRVQISE